MSMGSLTNATPGPGPAMAAQGGSLATSDLAVLTATIKGLSEQLSQLAVRQAPQRALSKRAAAQLLGISRGRTLDRLIQAGEIRTVQIGTRIRVPLSEVERILTVGAPDVVTPRLAVVKPRTPRPSSRPPPNMRQELAKARAIKISDL